MPLRSALLIALVASVSALPAVAGPPAAAAASAPERVQLRWKVPQGTPVAYEFITQQVGPGKNSMRLDLSGLKNSKLTAKQRKAIFELQLPSQSAMASVLSTKPSGDLSVKVVVTRMDIPKKKRPTKADKQMAQAMENMVGTVQIRASMTDWGFVTTDLKREQRNLVALMFELPSKPVAVGESWTHSADLVKMGTGWEGESESLNRVELVSLDKEADGQTVAVIDFTLAERQDGKFSNARVTKTVPASMEMSFVGRGEFLVEQGRWKRIAGRMTTKATGVMETDTEQQFTLMPLDPIPPKVLAAE